MISGKWDEFYHVNRWEIVKKKEIMRKNIQNIITGMKIRDTTAGFKCYKKEVLETIGLDDIKLKGYAFQIEMKFRAWKYGFKIKEVPIVFTDRKQGTSKMSGGIFNEAVWGVLKMKMASYFKKYDRN